MVDKKTWEEFKECGMLWWINMILHTLGWAIVFNYEEDGTISSVYPARVKFRGFDSNVNDKGYIKVSEYMAENAPTLLNEARS
jgi:hypothetical protein